MEPGRSRTSARRTIVEPRNTVYVSAASVWEMAIKSALGKLTIPDDLDEQFRLNRFDVLPIALRHAQAVAGLPLRHRDPFDRMIVVQARIEGLRLVTRDPLVQQYDVDWLAA